MNRKQEAVFMGPGILEGLVLSGSAAQAAISITATLSNQPIYVNDQRISMTAYSIGGNNYVKLRDIGRAVDIGVTYNAATNSVHIDSAQPYQEEIPTAPSDPTEESIQAVLAQLRETYPTGGVPHALPFHQRRTVWPWYPLLRLGNPVLRCRFWGSTLAAGGSSWEQIRLSDLIRYDNSSNGHVVVVVKKTDEYIKVTESGLNNKVRWGGQYFKWWLEEQPGYAMYTRYPQ